jgi:hypothetical protein
MGVEPLLLPDPASDPQPELLEGVPPELLLADPELELPLLLPDAESELPLLLPDPELELPLLPEPDWPPDEPLLDEPLPEPLVEPFCVPLEPPVEPPLPPLPPLEVLPLAAFPFVLVPLLLPVDWLPREFGVVREPEHSQAPPASAATRQGAQPIFRMVTPSNPVRTDCAVTGPFTALAKGTRDHSTTSYAPRQDNASLLTDPPDGVRAVRANLFSGLDSGPHDVLRLRDERRHCLLHLSEATTGPEAFAVVVMGFTSLG